MRWGVGVVAGPADPGRAVGARAAPGADSAAAWAGDDPVVSDPGRVLVAGDWHGDTRWARGVADLLPALLPDERPRRIVHVGDFGIWPGRAGLDYLLAVTAALAEVNGELWFVDGNHEDHSELARLM